MISRSIFVVVAIFVLSSAASAHHTHAHYEPEASRMLEGTVKDFDWRNPHSWVTLTVANAETGIAEDWLLEARAPVALIHRGWTQESLKPGDQIVATVRPLKSGGAGGLLRQVEFPDGKVLLDD